MHMNGDVFRRMVQRHGPQWVRRCWGRRRPRRLRVVMDHARCLWQAASLRCLQGHGLLPICKFPKCSPDLNAIEGVWARLRQRLETSAPMTVETRNDFLSRLRRALRHLNRTRGAELHAMCSNQKERARDVIRLNGSRTGW